MAGWFYFPFHMDVILNQLTISLVSRWLKHVKSTNQMDTINRTGIEWHNGDPSYAIFLNVSEMVSLPDVYWLNPI
jgi:hypothetical protein